MPDWLMIVLGVAGGVLLLWLALIGVLWVQQHRVSRSVDWREMLRLVPDVVRLVKRLASDPSVPRATRWLLLGLLGYLISPLDLVPDFVPVLGFADDVVVAALVLRFAIRHAGTDTVERHWPGSREGLASVLALAGLTTKTPSAE
jgi:uncharacterized membrane protein YkvA (DUF1232 family)